MPCADLMALITRMDSAVSKMNATDDEIAETLSIYDQMLAAPADTVGEAHAKLAAICRFNANGDIPRKEIANVVADLERLSRG